MNSRFRKLNAFALPLLIQTIATNVMEVTDSAIVARVSTPAFNAVGVISSLLYLIAGIFGAITIVFNTRGGKKLGEEDEDGFKFEFYTSLFLSAFIGLSFMVLIMLTKMFLLKDIYGLDEATLEQALLFIRPMSLYVLFQLLIFAFGTFYKVNNNTKWIFYSSIVASVINLVLDALFVLGLFGLPKLGVEMAGYSTVISMLIQLVIYYFVARKDLKFKIEGFKDYLYNCISHLKTSLPIMAEEIIDGTVFGILVNIIIIKIGRFEYAGYIVINNLLVFLFMYKYIYGSASLTLVSLSFGKKDKNSLVAYPKMASTITTFLYLITAIVFFVLKYRLVGAIIEDNNVHEVAIKYLGYFFVFNIVSCIGYIYKCSLQGIEDYKFILYSTFAINLFTLLVMISLVHWFHWSLVGVAFAVLIDETITMVIFRDKYKKLIKKV